MSWQRPTVITVTGGRDYEDRKRVIQVLDERAEHWMTHHPERRIFLVQGGAKGLDLLARKWAELRMIPFCEIPADWDGLGKKAGSLRNQEMLDWFIPDEVIVFPGGRGTADMKARVEKLIALQVKERRVTLTQILEVDRAKEDWEDLI